MSELKQRLLYSSIFIIVAGLIITLAPYLYFQPIFVAIVSCVIGIALWEYYLLAKAKGLAPSIATALWAVPFYLYAVYIAIIFPAWSALPWMILAIFLVLFFFEQFIKADQPIVNLSVTVFGIAYILIPLSCFISITYFFPASSQWDGRCWLIYLIAVTKMTDIGGLFVGRCFGRHKLAQQLSPNKTIEGSLGGILFGIAASLMFYLLADVWKLCSMHISLVEALGLGFLLSILAQIGDLSESLLKRDGGVKDSNPHLPGLGGALDILDSLLFTTPAVYLFLLIMEKS